MRTFVETLLGVALLISPQLISGSSITPAPASPITLGTRPPVIASILPVNSEGSQQKPQISPPRIANDGQQPLPQQQQQILPALLPGPLQPSSDIVPPEELLEANDGSFVNAKRKRDNEVQAQNVDTRFFRPGGNWGWTGIIGGSPENAEAKEGNCPASPPISSYLLTCQLQECEEDANCFGERKCCRFHCACICVNPVIETGKAADKEDTLLRHLIPLIIFNEGGNNANREKPGSCSRPGNSFGSSGSGYYRGRRQVAYDNNQIFNADTGASPYYTTNGGNGGGFGGGFGGGNGGSNYNPGGQHGGNYPGGNYNPGGQHGGNGGGSSYCNRDGDCPGNKKCCSRLCRTPAYIG